MTLVLGSQLAALEENGSVGHAEFQQIMSELDDVDGFNDGRPDVDILCPRNQDGAEGSSEE